MCVLWLVGIGASAICPPWIYPPALLDTAQEPAAPRHSIFEAPQPFYVESMHPQTTPGFWITPQHVIDWQRLSLEWIGVTTLAAVAALLSESFRWMKPGP